MDGSQRKMLGLFFKTLANSRDLTQRDIASSLDLDRTMISKGFTGDIQADNFYERLAGYFDHTLEEALNSAQMLAAALGKELTPVEHTRLAHVITIACEKGGVGKTTLSVNLAASLAARELSVLLLDVDPQGNATRTVGLEMDGEELAGALRGSVPLEEVSIIESGFGFDVIPGGRAVNSARVELLMSGTGIRRVDDLLATLRPHYDVILIDTPPATDILQQGALVASDFVITPVILDVLALDGLDTLLDTIEQIMPFNPELEFLGCVVTIHDTRKRSQREILRVFESHDRAPLLPAKIRTDARVNEAQIQGVPVRVQQASSRAAKDYDRLAKYICEEVFDHGN